MGRRSEHVRRRTGHSPAGVRRGVQWGAGAVLAMILVAVGFWGYQWWTLPARIEQQVGKIETAFRLGHDEETLDLAQNLVRKGIGHPVALQRGAVAAMRSGKFQEGLQLLKDGVPLLPSDDRLSPLEARDRARLYLLQAQLAMQLRRLGTAERAYAEAVRLDERDRVAREALAMLRLSLGRFAEAKSSLWHLVQAGYVREPILTVLGTEEPLFEATEILERSLELEPDYLWPHFGLARLALASGNVDQAEVHLREVLKKYPDNLEIQAFAGRLLLEGHPEGWQERLRRWHDHLPSDADEDPGIWRVRGDWALRQSDHPAAVRSLAESLKRDPCRASTASRLAGALMAVGAGEPARRVADYARLLEELESRCHLLRESGSSYRTVARVAQLCEQLGRYWEAHAWTQLFLRRPPPTGSGGQPPADYAEARAQVEAVRQRVAKMLAADLPRVAVGCLPTEGVDWSKYPRPRWDHAVADSESTWSAELDRRPRFADVTEAVGIDFAFQNADDPTTPGMRLIETTGGGVAVLDYDRDGWPDLYFPDGGPWPNDTLASAPGDRLYRNIEGRRFVDVTEQAGLGDRSFSQGAAVGDIDNDGWPDLLVCNLGGNRLYRNNGDGTFTDITDRSGLAGNRWSTSAAIADLNRDGVPDLFIVNYLAGERALNAICGTPQRPRVCSPADCDASPDRFYLGKGDGTWIDATSDANVSGARGNGLGCVVGELTGEPTMAVFVANDATANFCYVNQAAAGEMPRFEEQAVPRGLAFSRDGHSQGCMGVAAGDFDVDGRLDLFVTNFYREPNALYRQQEGGLFTDESATRGIARSSRVMLGFGTQFLDAELDGLPDLVVTNGHIDDLSDQGVPYRMRPQYFRNLGGRFAEWPAGETGPYFERKWLGRGLARLDWNLDGRPEFVVSHIGAPAVLTENRTENAGHYLAVELVGRVTARDAIGATVTVTWNGRRLMQQLTAGDGYMASNHRRLVFGLGNATRIDNLEVKWPSGQTQALEGLTADQALRIVEGGEAFRLPR